MLLWKIAFRSVFRQRRRSILTGLTMVGGFVLLSLSLSMANGSYGSIIDLFTGMHTGHIQIHAKGYLKRPSLYTTIDKPQELESILEKQRNITAFSPRILSSALACVGTRSTGAKVIGIDPARERATTTLAKRITEGQFLTQKAAHGVVIGRKLADLLKAKLGDELVLISQGADGSIANDLFTVRGILGGKSDSLEQMNCYMHIRTAAEFLALGKRIHEIAIVLPNYRKAAKVAEKLKSLIPDETFEVHTWFEVEKQFYKSMQADLKGMWISIFVIMIIVALGVLNTVLMTIMERTREYGVLKALGTRPTAVMALIVYETAILSLIAVMVGLGLSFIFNSLFTVYGWDYPVPIEVGGIKMTTLRGTLSLDCFLYPLLITLFTAVIVSVFPAIRAARIVPVKAMRTH